MLLTRGKGTQPVRVRFAFAKTDPDGASARFSDTAMRKRAEDLNGLLAGDQDPRPSRHGGIDLSGRPGVEEVFTTNQAARWEPRRGLGPRSVGAVAEKSTAPGSTRPISAFPSHGGGCSWFASLTALRRQFRRQT